MKRIIWVTVGLAVISTGRSSVAVAQELPAAEKQKIESLIKTVENLDGATFVRNGREYDSKAAATFLRGKWKANRTEIKSAKDFVEKAGSFSNTSGLPYKIRFKSGKEIKSREYLLAELRKVERS